MSSTSERKRSKRINDYLFHKTIVNEQKFMIRIRNQKYIITISIFDILKMLVQFLRASVK